MRSLKRRLMIPVFAIGLSSLTTSANAACSPGTPQLIIYHAGSLTAAFWRSRICSRSKPACA